MVGINLLKGISKNFFVSLVGVGLIWLAFSLWAYSFYQIYHNESILSTQSLSIEEVWKAQGALQWWNNFFTTTILPLCLILALVGIFIFVIGLVREDGWKLSDSVKIEVIEADEEE